MLTRRPRWDAAPLRWGFELAVAAIVVALVWVPRFRIDRVLIIAIAALGCWAVLLLVHRPPGPRLARALARAELVAFNLALLLVLGETALRVADWIAPSPWLARADTSSARFLERMRRRQPPGTLRYGFPLSSRSYYDEPSAAGGRTRVVQLGDSFSYGVVPHRYHYTTVAERELARRDVTRQDVNGVEIANLGLPEAGPDDYLQMLIDDGLALRPLVVGVGLFVGNDVRDVWQRLPGDRAWRRFFDRDEMLLFLLPSRLARVGREQRGREGKAAAAVAGEASAKRLETEGELRRAFPWLDDPRLEPETLLPPTFLRVESERAGFVCAPDADFRPVLARLEEIQRRARPAPLLVTLIPDDFQLDDDLWAAVLRETGRSDLDRDLPQRRLADGLAGTGIQVLDLLPHLRRRCAPHRDRRHCYHLRDTHWNARGNQVAGRALAEALRPLIEAERARPGK